MPLLIRDVQYGDEFDAVITISCDYADNGVVQVTLEEGAHGLEITLDRAAVKELAQIFGQCAELTRKRRRR